MCPECGCDIESAMVAAVWMRRQSFRWRLFLLSPIIALPGLVLFGIGQPVLAFVLGWIFGYRASALDDELMGGNRTRLDLACGAFVLSLSWTVLSTIGLLILFALLFTHVV